MITAWLMHHWKPIALVLGVALVIGIGVHLWNGRVIANLSKTQQRLEQDNRRITDEYWEAIGERNALRVQAAQLKVEADAYREAGERRGANVAALDKQIGAVREQHDQIQSDVGDCATVSDCQRQLCAKYRAAGIRLSRCPD